MEVFAPDDIKWEKQDGEMPAPHDAVFAKEGHAITFAGKWIVVFMVLCVPSRNMKKGNIDNTH